MHPAAPGEELRGRDAEAIRIAAHFVEREQPVEGIKGGILDALRHHRGRNLLKSQRQLGAHPSAGFEGQDHAEKIEQPRVQVGPIFFGCRNRRRDLTVIFRIDIAWLANVRPVNGQAGHRRPDNLVCVVARVVAMQAVALAKVQEHLP